MVAIDKHGHIIRENEANSASPTERIESGIVKQLKQESNTSPSPSNKSEEDNNSLEEAITAKIQAIRKKLASVASEEDKKEKRIKEIAERLKQGLEEYFPQDLRGILPDNKNLDSLERDSYIRVPVTSENRDIRIAEMEEMEKMRKDIAKALVRGDIVGLRKPTRMKK